MHSQHSQNHKIEIIKKYRNRIDRIAKDIANDEITLLADQLTQVQMYCDLVLANLETEDDDRKNTTEFDHQFGGNIIKVDFRQKPVS